MAHPLDGCGAKVQRALFHVAELALAVQTEILVAPYRVLGQSDEAAGAFVIAETIPTSQGFQLTFH
jgi:hypothetical protein